MTKKKKINARDENGFNSLDREVFNNTYQEDFIAKAFDLINQGAKLKQVVYKGKKLSDSEKKNILIAVFFYKNKDCSLYEACKALENSEVNDKDSVKNFLIEKRINEKDERGYTPLHKACKMPKTSKKTLEIATFLIKHGAKINEKDSKNNIPIYYSCLKGNINLTKLLIDHEANVDFTTKEDFPLTTFAYQQGKSKITKLLINYQSDAVKSSILNQACQKKDKSMIKYIVQNIFNHKKEEEAKIQFFLDCILAKNLGTDKVNIYIKKEIENTDINQLSPKWLLVFSKFYNEELIEKLVDAGADINMQDKNGKTALHYACASDNYEVATPCLLKKGADINIKDIYGKTHFHYAKSHGFHSSVLTNFLQKNNLIDYWKTAEKPTTMVEKIFSKIKTDIIDPNLIEKLQNDLKAGLEKLSHNEALNTILEFAAEAPFEITLWSHSHIKALGFCSRDNNDVVIFKISDANINDILSTIIHEITHLVAGVKFDNKANPFYATKNNSKIDQFIELAKSSKEKCPEIFEILDNYTEDQYPCELIAFYFKKLAEDILTDKNTLGKNFAIDSELVQAMWEAIAEINPKIAFNDLLAEVIYVSDSFNGFFENMLGIDEVKNIGDVTLNDSEDNVEQFQI